MAHSCAAAYACHAAELYSAHASSGNSSCGRCRVGVCFASTFPPPPSPPTPAHRDIVAYQRRLAEIIEMIHTASLVHDDVLDDCSVRRGEGLREAWLGPWSCGRVAAGGGDPHDAAGSSNHSIGRPKLYVNAYTTTLV